VDAMMARALPTPARTSCTEVSSGVGVELIG